jgi:hypothetical protein
MANTRRSVVHFVCDNAKDLPPPDRQWLVDGVERLHRHGPRVGGEFLAETTRAADTIPEMLDRLDRYRLVAPEAARSHGDADQKVRAEQVSQGSQQAELTRPLLFAREDWGLYVSLRTLPQRAGVPGSMLPWLIAKELSDNALDAADAAGPPGQVDTRATKDLIDKNAATSEPLKVFAATDADAAGTRIGHALQHATPARGARAIEVIDLGLQPWEGIALGLAVEKVPVQLNRDGTPRRRPVGDYVRARTDCAPTGETWEEWLQHSRVELNAFTSAELIAWLDRKMAEHDAGKLIPPDDILADTFDEQARKRTADAVNAAIDTRRDALVADIEQQRDAATADIQAEIDRITADQRSQLAERFEPFKQRIEALTADAAAIDRETLVHQALDRMRPDAKTLRAAVADGLADRPTQHWADALADIAHAANVGDINIELDGGE